MAGSKEKERILSENGIGQPKCVGSSSEGERTEGFPPGDEGELDASHGEICQLLQMIQS